MEGGDKADLTVLWFAWQPCEALGELSSQYEGANVTVNCVPIGEWYNTTFTDFAAQGGADSGGDGQPVDRGSRCRRTRHGPDRLYGRQHRG